MKELVTIILLACSLPAIAQSKEERLLTSLTYILSHTVFGDKDSISLEKLFAMKLTYGHSKGKIETREEAIRNIIHNTSTYKDTAVTNLKVLISNKTAIVRHLFTAKEIKKDGTIVPLNFTMILVWVKQNKHWRLMGRQAVALPNQ